MLILVFSASCRRTGSNISGASSDLSLDEQVALCPDGASVFVVEGSPQREMSSLGDVGRYPKE